MRLVRMACIVEGEGEIEALPVLLRRLTAGVTPPAALLLPRENVFRVSRSKLVKPGELEKAVELGARRAGRGGALLVLLDSDDDCPAHLGPALLQRMRQTRPDMAGAVVLAHREFEAWYLAAAASLRGCRGLPSALSPPPAPENIRDAKGWLSKHLGRRYDPITDQAALAARFDLEAARSAGSFDKLYRDVLSLLGQCGAISPNTPIQENED